MAKEFVNENATFAWGGAARNADMPVALIYDRYGCVTYFNLDDLKRLNKYVRKAIKHIERVHNV